MWRVRTESFQGVSCSLVVHALTFGLIVVLLHHAPGALSPLRMPGTKQGTHPMLTYSLGGPRELKQSAAFHTVARQPTPAKLPSPSRVPAPVSSAAAPSEQGSGLGGSSALGDEDVHVALPQIHPRPQPDLSTLAHGAAGDVVVDVVIDDAGKVTSTTLVKGLGPAIDGPVVAVLRNWTFSPATRNGQNVASEQEILIHYERG